MLSCATTRVSACKACQECHNVNMVAFYTLFAKEEIKREKEIKTGVFIIVSSVGLVVRLFSFKLACRILNLALFLYLLVMYEKVYITHYITRSLSKVQPKGNVKLL